MKKKSVVLLVGLLSILGIFYLYQVSYKKYIVQQKLYVLLFDEGIEKNDINIHKILIDIKSSRGGYEVFFSVNGSSLNYQYDYSFKDSNWIKTYEKDGFILQTEKINFDTEENSKYLK